MDALLKALADLIEGWGWLIILIGLPSLGDAIGRWSAGRRAIAKLKAENKALRREPARGDAQAQSAAALGMTTVVNPAHEALLWRVQATDNALPQLPQGLRDDIDAVLERSSAIVEREKK